MVEGRTEALDQLGWNHVSALMAHISNALRFSPKTPITHPADLNPYYAQEDDKPLKLPFSILRDLFVPQGEPTLTKREENGTNDAPN